MPSYILSKGVRALIRSDRKEFPHLLRVHHLDNCTQFCYYTSNHRLSFILICGNFIITQKPDGDKGGIVLNSSLFFRQKSSINAGLKGIFALEIILKLLPILSRMKRKTPKHVILVVFFGVNI